MQEENKTTPKKKPGRPKATKSSLIGNQIKSVPLQDTTKLDIDTNNKLLDNIIDAGLSNTLNISAIEEFTSISNSRDTMYQLIDTMGKDADVAAVVRTYAEEVCAPGDHGHIIWCESEDPKISKFVNYLLNVANVDKNIFGWAYSLIKYGDVYLKLFRESDYKDPFFNSSRIAQTYSARNVLNEDYKKAIDEAVKIDLRKLNDNYSYYIEQVYDPGTMFELTYNGVTMGYIEVPDVQTGIYNQDILTNSGVTPISLYSYQMKSTDVIIHQADDYVHAMLDDNITRYPEKIDLFNITDDDPNHILTDDDAHYSYNVRRGKSMLYDVYKVWREKALLEASILLNRITRSSIVRKVQVEVGDMPKDQTRQTLRRVKEMFEQKTALNTGVNMTNYTNPGPVENFVYFATHEGKGAVTVESVGGDVEVKNLADLDQWINKFYGAFGIPKQYFGQTDDSAGFDAGKSLSIISTIFATGVRRVQNALIQAITDAINLFLINKGCKAYLNNFVLKMKAPLTQEEIDARANFNDRVSAISNLNSLFADVENKGRRLRILKGLISTLDYGDAITNEIEEEIKAADAADKKAAEEAEENRQAELAGAGSGAPAPEPAGNEEPAGGGDFDLNLDMDNVPEAPKEGFKPTSNSTVLNEDHEFDDVLEEGDDLPTPEELGKDFTKNI